MFLQVTGAKRNRKFKSLHQFQVSEEQAPSVQAVSMGQSQALAHACRLGAASLYSGSNVLRVLVHGSIIVISETEGGLFRLKN